MLSIERVKELIKDKNISDEEAKQIRDELRTLAEIIFEQWLHKKRKEQKSDGPLNKSRKTCYDENASLPEQNKPIANL
jgi:signal-transduction protein with cAMP-binding, CBS, and nucleotidyltransferase domain